MFYTRTPDGFTQVDDVRLENGAITIEDRKHDKKIVLEGVEGAIDRVPQRRRA